MMIRGIINGKNILIKESILYYETSEKETVSYAKKQWEYKR